jgi:hypothetical protein
VKAFYQIRESISRDILKKKGVKDSRVQGVEGQRNQAKCIRREARKKISVKG